MACSSSPSQGTDAATVLPVDATTDVATDARSDVGMDVAADVAADVRADVAADVRADAATDVAADVRADVTSDAVADAVADAPTSPVTIQVLDVSDWHGQIDPLRAARMTGGTAEDIGGAAVLSAYFRRDRMMNPNTLTVTAGDAFGASPPLASFFEERPAVIALNAMGVQVDTFGNHNFDRGIAHLQSMIDLSTAGFVSSNLDNVSANLMRVASPFRIFTVGGVQVGVVGVTNADVTSLTSPGRLGTIMVRDPAMAAMSAAAAARAAGAQVLIALCHMGATGENPMTHAPTGPLADFANAVSGFDLILGDHTDVAVNTTIHGMTVVENRSKGLTYARIQLTWTPSSRTVTDRRVEVVSPWAADVTPDPAVVTALMPFRTMLTAQLDRVIGTTSAVLPRGMNVERIQEVALGDLVADAIRLRYGVQVAMVNSGGLRAALPESYMPADRTLHRPQTGYATGTPIDLVAGDIFAVLPFGNVVVTRTVTGRQIWALLERSVSMLPAPFGGFLQVSGLRFTYSAAAAAGSRVRAVTLTSGAAVMADDTTYTFATSDFTNTGGDGYTLLADGSGTSRDLMADVVLDYVRGAATMMMTRPLSSATDGRIMALP